jgi:hypothetical protein
MRQASSGQMMVVWCIGGNPPQRVATTSETSVPIQLKAPGALGQIGWAKLHYGASDLDNHDRRPRVQDA